MFIAPACEPVLDKQSRLAFQSRRFVRSVTAGCARTGGLLVRTQGWTGAYQLVDCKNDVKTHLKHLKPCVLPKEELVFSFIYFFDGKLRIRLFYEKSIFMDDFPEMLFDSESAFLCVRTGSRCTLCRKR